MNLHKFFSPPRILFLLICIGVALHFINVNWGAPWYFHPDERNIATSVSQLQFPKQMNPHFFAYGTLPIYAIYFTGIVLHFFSTSHFSPLTSHLSFEEAIIMSRMYSALFATLLIPLLFLFGQRLQSTKTGLLAAALATFSTGLIQFSHFGTFELWLTFFSVCLFWHCLNLLNREKIKDLIWTGAILGGLVAIKVSSLVLILLPLLVLLYKMKQGSHQKIKAFGRGVIQFLFLLCVSVGIYIITNPYVFSDQKDFVSSMTYESGVGLGTLPVFYTGGFYNTIPIVYQLLHVYPFLLNPIVTTLFIGCFVFFFVKTVKSRNKSFILLSSLFSILLLSQASLFVKWTRYMVPTLPFIYLIIAIIVNKLPNHVHWKKYIHGSILALIILCAVFSFSYFKTAFLSPDTRLTALAYAKQRLSQNATILSEPYDLGIFPMQTVFPQISTFNFYDLDTNSFDANEYTLQQQLAKADYIIVPSQRILQPRIQNQERFPKGHAYYEALLNGKLGFQKMYETPCDIFCQITYLGDPIYWWEQTVNVFDHPTVFIFKKI